MSLGEEHGIGTSCDCAVVRVVKVGEGLGFDFSGRNFLRNISLNKIVNQKVEAYYRPRDLSDCRMGDLCSVFAIIQHKEI